MERIKKKIFNLGIWASVIAGYLAFAIVGGLCFLKSESEEIKATAKRALIVVLIFVVIEMFLSAFNYFAGMFNGYYGSGAYSFYSVASKLVGLAKIITVVVFAVLEIFSDKFLKNKENKKEEKSDSEKAESEL